MPRPDAPLSAREPQHFDFIDALRGIACLMVFAYHVGLHYTYDLGGSLPRLLSKVVNEGARGVQLFYVISAFTLFHSFGQRRTVDSRPTTFFLLRRFFRIAPLFYFMIVVYAVFDYLKQGSHPHLGDILVHVGLLHGLTPPFINTVVPGGWSIGVEVLFYLLIPFLFSSVTSLRHSLWFVMAAIVFARLSHAVAAKIPLLPTQVATEQFLFFWLPNQLPIFALGFVLFFWIGTIGTQTPRSEETRKTGTLLLSMAAFCGAALLTGPGFKLLNTYLLFGVVFVVLAVGLCCQPTFLVVNRVTRFFGKISYSVYLVHVIAIDIVGNWVFRGHPGFFVGFCCTLVVALSLTAVMAWITYRLIEVPGQQLGKRIIRRLAVRDAASL
jgi:peptidoglycan/LPS O-acetylase OafA/YrhL